MSIYDRLIAIYVILNCFIWSIHLFQVVRVFLALKLFENQSPASLENFPPVSVIVAARNEADTIEKAMTTLLHLDYPNLEIIAVNDRSDDDTGKIIDQLALKDLRLKVFHIETLPEGWLGKVNALHRGTQKAGGEWILYTDADVHFKKDSFKKALSIATDEQADHLVILPFINLPSFWLKVAAQTFGVFFLQGLKAGEIGRKNSNAYIGAGGFNLVRKSFFDKTEGFPWLRMEVIDDVGLGLMMSRKGAKPRFLLSKGDINVTWYPSLGAMIRGLEKNAVAITEYGFKKLFLSTLLLTSYGAAPLAASVCFNIPYLWTAALTVFLLLAITGIVSKMKVKYDFLPSLLSPFGVLLISYILLRSWIKCRLNKGISWRDTHYGIEELRAGQRVKF